MKRYSLLTIGVISTVVLIFALIRQYGFGDLPCYLCFYERIPYGLAGLIGIGAGGYYAVYRPLRLPIFFMAIIALIFIVSSGLAFYHIGVEQKWFALLEACREGLPEANNFEEFFTAIKERPMPRARCDEAVLLWGIPYTFYNLGLSLLMVLWCGWWFVKIERNQK